MKMLRSFEPALATIKSSFPLPVKSATVSPTGSVPVAEFERGLETVPAQTEVHEDFVLTPVDDDHVGVAVAVQVGDRDRAGA